MTTTLKKYKSSFERAVNIVGQLLTKSETLVGDWKNFYKRNNYYHLQIYNIAANLVPGDASVIEFGSRGGELLRKLPNKVKVGVELDSGLVSYAKKKNAGIRFFTPDAFWQSKTKFKFDYILLNHFLSDLDDIQNFITKLKSISHKDTKIVVLFYNFLWKPVLDLTEKLKLRMPYQKDPNWLAIDDIDNLLYLESWDKVKSGQRTLLPVEVPLLSILFNKYISRLPFFKFFSLTKFIVYRQNKVRKDCSVSIIIPARNEAGNMEGVIKKIPKMGSDMEIIFVEGHSQDDTYNVIKKEITKYKGSTQLALYKQKGKGKGDAVRLGFSKAHNDLLMILDADLTVDPKELPKFYKAVIEGRGDFIMGSRLIYPMEKLAMRSLNILGNKFFSLAFTFLLDQKIKDTLCGTKILFKNDYEKIKRNRKIFGDFDPFGDYDLIFGASKLNLKIVEIPIRYKERTYGTTNISRFIHGWLLFKMVFFAAKNLKFT